ncbi:MAG: hypothetical protein H8K09_04700 [Nitrospira sp.]|jgi:hypothetical protein|nr:hypothetical protein [Nitrospira sp.]ULA66105.1 MAG: hypothetical protein LZF62_50090 [Nitrospira sp.]
MPIYFLGALTVLICVIAVWATVAEDDETTTYADESESAWEPFEEQKDYRKAS